MITAGSRPSWWGQWNTGSRKYGTILSSLIVQKVFSFKMLSSRMNRLYGCPLHGEDLFAFDNLVTRAPVKRWDILHYAVIDVVEAGIKDKFKNLSDFLAERLHCDA